MNNIRERRLELGLTQPELALAVGVSVNTIRSWEMEVTRPNDDNLKKLIQALEEREEK